MPGLGRQWGPEAADPAGSARQDEPFAAPGPASSPPPPSAPVPGQARQGQLPQLLRFGRVTPSPAGLRHPSQTPQQGQQRARVRLLISEAKEHNMGWERSPCLVSSLSLHGIQLTRSATDTGLYKYTPSPAPAARAPKANPVRPIPPGAAASPPCRGDGVWEEQGSHRPAAAKRGDTTRFGSKIQNFPRLPVSEVQLGIRHGPGGERAWAGRYWCRNGEPWAQHPLRDLWMGCKGWHGTMASRQHSILPRRGRRGRARRPQHWLCQHRRCRQRTRLCRTPARPGTAGSRWRRAAGVGRGWGRRWAPTQPAPERTGRGGSARSKGAAAQGARLRSPHRRASGEPGGRR